MESAQAQLRKAVDGLVNLPHDASDREKVSARTRLEDAKKAIRATGERMKSSMRTRMSVGRGQVPPREIVRPQTNSGEIICCPECFRTGKNNNTTNPLNRKQRRSQPKVMGYPAHPKAFCVHCSKRMVYMPMGEYLKKREEQIFNAQ
jgi:hypothetical protein